jgi:acetylornithine deacetylase/succinyl-diaminopimelate desuccinylase family protein
VEQVSRRIENREKDIIELTRRLVAIPTENPPGRCYRDCCEILAAELKQLGLPVEIIEVRGAGTEPRYIVASGVGEGPAVYLHGHYDVVPAQSIEQFNPVVRDGCIWGRGSSDMKGGIASMVYALDALKGIDDLHGGRVELILVPDEESGGKLGCEHLARIGWLGREGVGVILGEPTSGVIWNGSRGAITLRIRSSGASAHVALQHEGRNAFEGAIPIAKALVDVKREVEKRETKYRIEPRQARNSILMLGGEVSGGTVFNVVPGEFSFTVERRFNPEEDIDIEKTRLLDTIERSRPDGVNVEIDVIQQGASTATDAEGPFAQVLSGVVEEIVGRKPAFELCPGLLESRFYTEKGIPALTYGPGSLSVSHGEGEYVEIERLVECAKVYALTALRTLKLQAGSGSP